MRAALTRREPAIRDFYDIHYAIAHLGLDLRDRDFAALVQKKLAVPGIGPVDISIGRREMLERQLATQLKPVLRPQDFSSFHLDKVFGLVTEVAAQVRKEARS